MKDIEIKKEKEALSAFIVIWIIISLIMFFSTIYLTIEAASEAVVLFFLTLLCLKGLISLNNDYKDNESKMILSEQGIQLKNHDFYKWSDIEFYEIKEEGDSIYVLYLNLRTSETIKFNISSLDMTPEEIDYNIAFCIKRAIEGQSKNGKV